VPRQTARGRQVPWQAARGVRCRGRRPGGSGAAAGGPGGQVPRQAARGRQVPHGRRRHLAPRCHVFPKTPLGDNDRQVKAISQSTSVALRDGVLSALLGASPSATVLSAVLLGRKQLT